jgi:hypothetical protein
VGIVEIDECLHGDPFGAVGKRTLYRRAVSVFVQCRAEKPLKELDELLEEFAYTPKSARRVQNLTLFYEGLPDLKAVFSTLSLRLAGLRVVLAVSMTSEGTTVVYIHRTDTKYPPADLSIGDAQPKCLKFRMRGRGQLELTLQMFQRVSTSMVTDISISTPRVGEFSLEQLLGLTKTMTQVQMLMLKARARMIPFKERSEFQHVFLRVFADIKMIRELRFRTPALMFSAFDPPLPIVPMDKLVNLDHCGERLREVEGGLEKFSLVDLFDRPLLQKHGIVLLGANSTTGFGKTQFALRLAVEWAKAYNEVSGAPKDEAMVVFTNTVDAARELSFRRGYIWVLDDISLTDREQVIHMSQDTMKVLLAPSSSGSIRCRNQDLCLPAGVPRIFTANACSAVSWAGQRVGWAEPLQRKAVVFVITRPLCHESWRLNASSCASVCDDAEEVAQLMAGQVFRPPALPAPIGLVSRLSSAVRCFFNA